MSARPEEREPTASGRPGYRDRIYSRYVSAFKGELPEAEQAAALVAQSRDGLVSVFEVFDPAVVALLAEVLPQLAARLDARAAELSR